MEECPICLEQLDKQFVTISCCNKKFHIKCLSKSVSLDDKCPMCRSEQLSAEVVVVITQDVDVEPPSSRSIVSGVCYGTISLICFVYICYVGYKSS